MQRKITFLCISLLLLSCASQDPITKPFLQSTGNRDYLGVHNLKINIRIPSVRGMICNGEQKNFSVYINPQPAWIRIYSVAEDGRMVLGWVSETPMQLWQPEAVFVGLPGCDRYKIIAVAVPSFLGKNGFGNLLNQEDCITTADIGLPLDQLPVEAVVAVVEYRIESNCPRKRNQIAEDAQNYILTLPSCH